MPAEAISHWRKGIASGGDYSDDCKNNLGWLLATSADDSLRDGPEAVRLSVSLLETETRYLNTHKTPHQYSWTRFGTAAAAYAEIGKFDDAVRLQEVSLKYCPPEQSIKANHRLNLYKNKQPHREADYSLFHY